jgi:uracil-DNA glycosylase
VSSHPIRLEASWKSRLGDVFKDPRMQALGEFLRAQKTAGKVIYPPGARIFAALDSTPFDRVKVVILGQDPYHGPGQAHGLCFSVPHGIPVPPSLVNIYREIERDLGIAPPRHGCLDAWAGQGVLLLNAVLTVERGQAGSHQNKGWEYFTDACIEALGPGA